MILLLGASGGIGQILVKYLSKLDDVIGVYNNERKGLVKSNKITYKKIDLQSQKSIEQFVNNNEKILNKITIVNAAGYVEDSLAINHDIDAWKKVLDVNLTANFLTTKYILPYMVKQKWGRIIHISSIRSSVGTISYTASKSALNGLSSVLAKEYAKFNITSNIIVLGAFNVGMYDKLNEKIRKQLLNDIPSKKLGDVMDIYNAIEFIIKSDYLNGASIVLDGGATA